jgi:predicted AAA+ superfamily ATPase
MEILTLGPLSRQELGGSRKNLVEALFRGTAGEGSLPSVSRSSMIVAMVRGGYPEIQTRSNGERCHAWFSSYITTILERDVRDLAKIEGLTELPSLLGTLATRSAGLLNVSDLSRSLGILFTTLRRYLTLLETTFLVTPLPAWSHHPGKRFVKASKIFLTDSGLMADLLGYESSRLEEEPGLPGPLFETFVHGELVRHLAAFAPGARLSHFRTTTGTEVDSILENRRGEIVGIEVKAASSLTSRDWGGLRQLREMLAERFRHGYVIYTGRETIPLAPGFAALPVGAFF